MKKLKKNPNNRQNFFKKNYLHISSIAIFFSITALIFYIFAFRFEDSIEEKQTLIQENRHKIEFLKEWIHDNEKLDLDALKCEIKLKADLSLENDLSKLNDESFYYLFNFGTLPFLRLIDNYQGNIENINDIVSDTFTTNTITNIQILLDQQYDRYENIMTIYDGPYKKNENVFIFNEIFQLYSDFKIIHLKVTSNLKTKIKEIEKKSFILENEIARFNSRTRNIILVAFSIQLLVYIFCQILEILFERRKRQ